jgi:hypothetical protein
MADTSSDLNDKSELNHEQSTEPNAQEEALSKFETSVEAGDEEHISDDNTSLVLDDQISSQRSGEQNQTKSSSNFDTSVKAGDQANISDDNSSHVLDDQISSQRSGEQNQTESLSNNEQILNIKNLPHTTPPSTLNNRYDVYPGSPLPEFDSASARAFKAEDKIQPNLELFGLICIPGLPVQWNEIEKISGKLLPGNIALSAFGNIDWPILGQKCLVLIFKRPLGGRVDLLFKAPDVSEQKKIDTAHLIVQTGITALLSLQERNLINRSIRPNNLFFADKDQEEIIFGEFVTSPPGFDQPITLETTERGMAAEGGRGTGTLSDDIYALAATTAALIQHQNPVRGKTREEIILSKINSGSYQTLIGKKLLTTTLLEPLHGMLRDNTNERWGLDELDIWRRGQSVPSKKIKSIKKVKRVFRFGGFGHTNLHSLAYSMLERRDSAIKIIKDGTLEQWLALTLKDTELADTISDIKQNIARLSDTMPHADELLLSRILITLNPKAPITYKDVVYMPDGFGSSIAIEMLRQGNIRNYSESILRGLPKFWHEKSYETVDAQLADLDLYANIEKFLKHAGPGFGIERCLYVTNTGSPCQSPIISSENIFTIDMLLPTLNAIEKSVDTKKSPIDRHIAAFIAARINRNIDSYLSQLGDLDGSIQTLGMLRLLVYLQDKMSAGTHMGLTKWVGGLMGPVIRLYHNRQKQKEIESEVPRLVRSGNLSQLLSLLDDPIAKQEDEKNFAVAVKEYHEAGDEITDIQENTGPGTEIAEHTSKRAAAITTILIMVFVVSMIIMTG